MPDKQHLLATLRAEYDRWQALLAGLDEDAARHPCAARRAIDQGPDRPPARLAADLDRTSRSRCRRSGTSHACLARRPRTGRTENLERINAWIHVHYRDQVWADVYAAWRWGFQRFLTLAAAIPEADLFDANRYTWLGGYAPADVLQGSYEHHDEHYEPLPDLLRQLGWIEA